MRLVRLVLALAACAGGASCDSGLGAAGEPCATSEECLPGLLCDFGKAPHVCAGTLSARDDLSVIILDGAVVDLSTGDP